MSTTAEPQAIPMADLHVGALRVSVPGDQVFGALAEAQGKMGRVVADKRADAGKYGYTYADLAGVLAAAREALAGAGLALIQVPTTEGALVVVTTMLAHSSGQWMASTIAAPSPKGDIQGIGSAITYLRRYAATAMLGLAPEDDDGQATTRGNGRGTEAPRRSEVPTPPHQSERAPSVKDQLRRLWHARLAGLAKANAVPALQDAERHALQEHLWGTARSSDLTEADASTALGRLRETPDGVLAAIVRAVVLGEGRCPHCGTGTDTASPEGGYDDVPF